MNAVYCILEINGQRSYLNLYFSGLVGQLTDEGFVENATNMEIEAFSDYKCMKVIKFKGVSSDESENSSESRKIFPLKFNFSRDQKRLLVLPNQKLYFTRVAKTGSSAFIGLMNYLQWKLDYGVIVKQKTVDIVIQPKELYKVKEEALSIVKLRDATAVARHYGFINFEKFGFGKWMPDYFGMVRDPIERVRSF